MVMLDWAKAFDRLHPRNLCKALLRFGVPSEMCDMIAAIYALRKFTIIDHSGQSDVHEQSAGIAQGCHLSPYLFIAVQTIMMHDVFQELDLQAEPPYVVTRDVLYADDTVLVSRYASNLQLLLDRIITEGRTYGLELNWDKTVQMQISTLARVTQPNGSDIKSVREVVYLGGLITCDGKAGREIARLIGEGYSVFDKLEAVWKHAFISTTRKVQIYETCIVTKLLYSLESVWLLQNEQKKLDAFHHKCLRRCLQIPMSYVSRVTNADVLTKANSRLLSTMLMHAQKASYVRITQLHEGDLTKQLVCSEGGTPIQWDNCRRRGRPRQRCIC